jgi:hypothetical protein
MVQKYLKLDDNLRDFAQIHVLPKKMDFLGYFWTQNRDFQNKNSKNGLKFDFFIMFFNEILFIGCKKAK